MSNSRNITNLLREHKTVFVVIAVVLFLIELEIFAIAAMKSGRKQYLQILDTNGNVIHETDGKSLSDFNKYYFEKTFGSLDNFEKKLKTKETPFPFRAWFTAAIGIPIGVILLFAFVVKAYIGIFHENEESEDEPGANNGKKVEYESQFEKILATVSSLNIFTIGFLILLMVLMYWVVPNAVTYIGRVSLDTVVRFKWVFIGAGAVIMGLFIWVVYLRYLLAKQAIDKQAELQKVRLQLEFNQEINLSSPQLEYKPKTSGQPSLVTWEKSASSEPEIQTNESIENG